MFDNFFNDIEIINEPYEDLKIKSKNLMKKYFLKIGKEKNATYYGYK